jgi:hypothetical protein
MTEAMTAWYGSLATMADLAQARMVYSLTTLITMKAAKQKSMYFGVDASQYDSLLLTFDVAYQVLQGYSDSLSVTASLDCGETFNRVYAKGGSSLASNSQIDTSSTGIFAFG